MEPDVKVKGRRRVTNRETIGADQTGEIADPALSASRKPAASCSHSSKLFAIEVRFAGLVRGLCGDFAISSACFEPCSNRIDTHAS